jgi:hypothetical protein
MVSNEANTKNTNPYHDAHQVIEINSPTIVDGGAYEGEMTERFLNLFSSPTIHAFEPLPRHVDLLKKKEIILMWKFIIVLSVIVTVRLSWK